jgi:hypothetical protein
MDDLKGMLDEQPSAAPPPGGQTEKAEGVETPVAPDEPKVLHLKVFYGMGEAQDKDGKSEKKPDPNKVLFYQGQDGSTYDVAQRTWVDPPSILDHLPSRPVQFDEKGHDIIRAIAHGVIDDEDYATLDKSGLINDTGKNVYGLYKKALDLTDQIDSLEKSEEVEAVEGDDAPPSDEESVAAVTKQGVDVPAEFMSVAGISGLEQVREQLGEEGENLFIQIIQAAMADVDAKTRLLVEEEVTRQIKPISDTLEAIMQHMGIQPAPTYNFGGADDEPDLTPVALGDNIEDEGTGA